MKRLVIVTFGLLYALVACRKIETAAGTSLISPSGHWEARTEISDMGGYKILRLHDLKSNAASNIVFADVTAAKWTEGKDVLFVSVSPIYGKSGIFKVDATGATASAKKVVGKTSDEWFELLDIQGNKVKFRYVIDIEKQDATHAVERTEIVN